MNSLIVSNHCLIETMIFMPVFNIYIYIICSVIFMPVCVFCCCFVTLSVLFSISVSSVTLMDVFPIRPSSLSHVLHLLLIYTFHANEQLDDVFPWWISGSYFVLNISVFPCRCVFSLSKPSSYQRRARKRTWTAQPSVLNHSPSDSTVNPCLGVQAGSCDSVFECCLWP